MTSKKTLKKWFSNFMKPVQEHFYAWIDSFWHKDEKIPMASIEGLERIIEGTASAGQLLNHLNDTNAHRALFENKVDKEDGKGLSSNDYTDEEKRTNETNAKKRVVGLTVTGDVTKTLTITLADGETIQATFDDKDTLPENVADIKLNSLMFDKGTGVLTGQRSDGTPLTVNLDGRYALIDHTHSWKDIKDKPAVERREEQGFIHYDIDGIGRITVPEERALLEKIQRKTMAIEVNSSTALNSQYAGRILKSTSSSDITIDLSEMPNNSLLSVVKAEVGNITFTGKTIIGDSSITGAKGSTASLLIHGDEVIINANNR